MTKLTFALSFMGDVTLSVPEREVPVYLDSLERLGHGPVRVEEA